MKTATTAAISTLCVLTGAGAAGSAAAQSGLVGWTADFEDRARSRGYDAALVDSLFVDGAPANETAIRQSQNQPEFVRPVWDYLDSAISDRRVADGRGRIAANGKLLEAIEQRYGVDRHVLVSIWGLESAYGEVQGDNDTPTALATLGWSGWRTDFVRGELFAILDMLRDGEARRDQLRGSWAGAMGQTQFMPTSYRRFAQDWNEDGLKDIWADEGDALASAAHYLAEAGWIPGLPPAVEVHLPEGFDWGASETPRPVRQWLMEGAQRADHAPWRSEDVERGASLFAPAGAAGPAFLTTENFRVIRAYNNSSSYALAVSMLANRLAGGRGVIGQWPRTEPRMSVDDAEALQAGLTAAGYDTQGVDGVIGPNTRAAIRAFQTDNGLTPDGAVSADLLARVRAAAE